MKRVLVLPSFEKAASDLQPAARRALAASLEMFNRFLQSDELPHGLRLKKIGHDTYEFRVDIKLRVIIKVDHNDYYLVLVGSHDDIRRHLKRKGGSH